MGATEYAASRRPSRPGGSRLIVKRVLSPAPAANGSDPRRWRPIAATMSDGCEGRTQRLDDVLLVVTIEARVERQRERARAAVLRHREHPLAEAVALAHVRLQVDRRDVRRGRDSTLLHESSNG